MSTTISKKITGLTPGQSVVVLARSIDGNGKYSDWASVPYAVPTSTSAGANLTGTNSSTDIRLNGGSLYAGTFTSNVGLFDPLTGTTTGSGVILNKFGIAGYASGVKQFYIDSRTGNATFSGTISGTIIKSNGYVGVTNGSAYSTTGTAFNLNDGSITAKKFRIDVSGNAYLTGAISGSSFNNLINESGISISNDNELGTQDIAFQINGSQVGNLSFLEGDLFLGNNDIGTALQLFGSGETWLTSNSNGLYLGRDDIWGATLDRSNPSGTKGLRNISVITTGDTEPSGFDGDIYLVY